MTDNHTPDNPSSLYDHKNQSWRFRITSHIKNAVNKYFSHKRQESSQDRATRYAAKATVIIAIFTAVSAAISIAQWCILSGQLAQMRNEQRPWVNFSVFQIGDSSILGGAIAARKDGNIGFAIRYSLTNFGHLPAIDSTANIDVFPLTLRDISKRGATWANLIKDRQKSACEKAEFHAGETVFPTENTLPLTIIRYVNRSKMDRITRRGKNIVAVLISACVGYRISPNSSNYAHTGASFAVSKTPSPNWVPMKFSVGEVLHMSDLQVVRMPLEIAN